MITMVTPYCVGCNSWLGVHNTRKVIPFMSDVQTDQYFWSFFSICNRLVSDAPKLKNAANATRDDGGRLHHCFDPELGILPYASQPSKNIPFRIPENLKSTTITATMVLL
jgi:hypothetical protein